MKAKSSIQEYDRSQEEVSDTKEKEIEDAIDKLTVVVTDINPRDLKDITFCDYHIMLDMMGEEEVPACDFGVYVSSINRNANRGVVGNDDEYDIEIGDMVICVEDEDITNKTSAQLNNFLLTVTVDKNIQFLLGRR